jgi:dipeptide transport system permease protein
MRKLAGFLLKRLLLIMPLLLALSLVLFSTMTLIPLGERIRLHRNEFNYQNPLHSVDDEVIIEKYHLNDPFYIQWLAWLTEVFHGNLGYSVSMGVPVSKGLAISFKATLEVVMFAAPLSIMLGYKLGVLSAKLENRKTRFGGLLEKIIRVVSVTGYSTPAFFLGFFFLLVFYIGFHWPSLYRLGLQADTFVRSSEFVSYTGLHTVDAMLNNQLWILIDALQHLTLPVLTLTITVSPIITRITRTSMMEELSKPYNMVARAKGLSEKAVVNRAKKPSAFPIFTVSAIVIATMLTGIVVVEYIFQIHGLGYWLVTAATRWDYSLLVSIILLFCFVFIITNLIVDFLYTYLDPRVKL